MDEATPRFSKGVALVAGGSGGLGAAIARTLARAGSDIALTYHRNRSRAEEVAAAIEKEGRKATIAAVDLADESQTADFVARAAENFGGIHTTIYAAGPYINMRHVSRLDGALFRETVGTDLFGCYHLLQSSLKHLRDMRGAIVALATPAIRRATARDVMSAAPKAAVEAVIKHIAAEEGRFGVRANCVGVGVIDDGMFHQLIEKGDFDTRFLETTKATLALRRLGNAQEIADAVAFLASDRASYITGQTLMVDGGYAI